MLPTGVGAQKIHTALFGNRSWSAWGKSERAGGHFGRRVRELSSHPQWEIAQKEVHKGSSMPGWH